MSEKFKIDLTGYNYHNMIGIEFLGKTQNNVARWKFRCICENIVILKTPNVMNNTARKHCGCLTPPDMPPKRALYGKYIHSAKTRSIEFQLTFDEFISLTDQNCIYCNHFPDATIKRKGFRCDYKYNGIDRKNNNLGYTVENSVSCCKICNIAKASLSENEFKLWIVRLYNNLHSNGEI